MDEHQSVLASAVLVLNSLPDLPPNPKNYSREKEEGALLWKERQRQRYRTQELLETLIEQLKGWQCL